MEFVTVR